MNTTVVAAESLSVADLGGESVILDSQSGKYYGLNEVGSLVLELAQRPITVLEITESIQRQYDAPPHTVEEDVNAFLNEMISAELIKVVEAS